MRQTREIKNFMFGHHFSDGLRITLGVLLPALLFAYLGRLETGITISLGAFCVSIADNPGPVVHKRNGMLYCNLCIFLTAILTCAINAYPIALALEIVGLCFFFSMFLIYGTRASSVGTAALLIMILSIDQRQNIIGILEYSACILTGGLWYMALSLSVSQIRPYRLAQQELGECIRQVAHYLSLKADFYDEKTDFDKSYKKLIAQQIIVHNQQDVVRELLFKSRMMVSESTTTGRLLILVFVDIVDLFEQAMATHQDYQAIRQLYGKTGALNEFKQIIVKLADDLENLSYHITSNERPDKIHDFQPELEKLKTAIDLVEQNYGLNNFVLKKILINVRNVANRIQKMYSYFNPRQLINQNIRSNADLRKFVSHQEIDLKLFKSNLNFNSSIFRHSLRVAIVCLIGYLVSKLFPFGHHSYWILLTILVILKPGFSLTKQRNYERLIGTFIGGIAGACILLFIKDETARFILLLIFMMAAYSFQRLNYVVSVLFMTPYILILFSFLGASTLNIAQERILDTFVGSIIAFAASYLLFPSWEYPQLKNYMRETLIANYNYLLKVADGLTAKPENVTAYKLARKEVYVSTANLASAFQRMLAEPKSKQRNAKNVHKFVVLNHSLSSYTATLISSLGQPTNRQVNTDHIKLIRKCLYSLSDSINQLEDADSMPFKGAEIMIPTVKNQPEDLSPDIRFLTEQLEFVNNLTTDIQKISEKLSK